MHNKQVFPCEIPGPAAEIVGSKQQTSAALTLHQSPVHCRAEGVFRSTAGNVHRMGTGHYDGLMPDATQCPSKGCTILESILTECRRC